MLGTKRNTGLDFIRSLAILFVLYRHGIHIIYPHVYHSLVDYTIFYSGFFGVELFFVLSGFLIGRIFLNAYYFKGELGITDIVRFWKRRWLRTMPNYYFVLFLYFLIYGLIGESIPSFEESVRYIFFLQNFISPNPLFFSQAWSLSVEEIFYLMLPLQCFLLTLKSGYKFKPLVALIISNIIFFNMIRIYSFIDTGIFGSQLYTTVFRLDSILYGVLLSLLFRKYEKWFTKHKTPFFLAGLFGLMSLYTIYAIKGNSVNGVYFLIILAFVSPFIALTFPFLIDLKFNNTVARVFLFISTISYSLYLVHLLVIDFLVLKIFDIRDAFEAWVGYVFFWVISFFLSYVLYMSWEKRFINYRNNKIKE